MFITSVIVFLVLYAAFGKTLAALMGVKPLDNKTAFKRGLRFGKVFLKW